MNAHAAAFTLFLLRHSSSGVVLGLKACAPAGAPGALTLLLLLFGCMSVDLPTHLGMRLLATVIDVLLQLVGMEPTVA